MGTPFQIGDKVFVHADASVAVTCHEGQNPGVPFEDFKPSGINAASNGTAAEIQGNDLGPLVVVLAKVAHEFGMKLDVMAMVTWLAQYVGDGFARFAYDVVVTFTRAGLPSIAWTAKGVIFENLANFSSDAGGQPKSEVKGKATKITITVGGVEIDPYKLPEGTAVEE